MFDTRTAGDLLADPETPATVLHAIALAAYKDELYGDADKGVEQMDPVELWVRLEEDFRTTIPEENENKLNALMFAISTDAFYEDPTVFTAVCMALYEGDLGDMVEGTLEDLTVPEMLWGIYEVELNRDDQPDFMPGVRAVMDSTIAEEAEENEQLEEVEVVPYYERFVDDMRLDLLEGLRKLGVPEQVLRRLSMQDLTPTFDDEGKYDEAER